MESSDWTKFFELVERLQNTSPEVAELALRYSRGGGQQVLEEAERALSRPDGRNGSPEPLFDASHRVNVDRLMEFHEQLRKEEDELREKPAAAQDLQEIQAAQRGLMKVLKEMLLAERRFFAMDQWEGLHATEEEILAGLQELKEKGGLELHEFIHELEQMVAEGERAET